MSKNLYMMGILYKNGKNSKYIRQIRKYKSVISTIIDSQN